MYTYSTSTIHTSTPDMATRAGVWSVLVWNFTRWNFSVHGLALAFQPHVDPPPRQVASRHGSPVLGKSEAETRHRAE